MGARGETGRLRAIRATLRQTYMKPIVVIAQGRLREVPEFRSLQLPAPRISTPPAITPATPPVQKRVQSPVRPDQPRVQSPVEPPAECPAPSAS